MRMKDDWQLLAACRTGDPDALFVEGAAQHMAKRICFGCPVQYECLAEALDSRIESGVWGGMTERERRSLLRHHPEVANWRRLFLAIPATLHGIHPQAAVALLVAPGQNRIRSRDRWRDSRQSPAEEETRSSSASAL